MVDGVTAGKNNGSEILEVYTLLTEFLGRNTFYVYEFAEIDLETVLLRKISIRVLVRIRPWLSNEDALYFKIGIF